MLCKVTHCTGRVLANTRPHQLLWSDWEMETVIVQLLRSYKAIAEALTKTKFSATLIDIITCSHGNIIILCYCKL